MIAGTAFLVLVGLPLAVLAADPHRDAVLRLVSISAAVAEEAGRLQEQGALAIDRESRMPASECTQFFQDLVSLKNIEVVSQGSAKWSTLGGGAALPNLDPDFKAWRDDRGRQLKGYIVVRWRDKAELLLRAHRTCADGDLECSSPAFQHLDVHDKAGPTMVCAVLTAGAGAWRDWTGKLSPMLLELPGQARGPARVFPVDVRRAPPGQPLPGSP